MYTDLYEYKKGGLLLIIILIMILQEMKWNTCHPASMLLRSDPSNEPDRTQIWDKLNSFNSSTVGSQTLIDAFAP